MCVFAGQCVVTPVQMGMFKQRFLHRFMALVEVGHLVLDFSVELTGLVHSPDQGPGGSYLLLRF
jgi:hypothetical protein